MSGDCSHAERARRALPLLLLLAAACSGGVDGHVCTALFATIGVRVVDAQGSPVEGLAIADTVLRTGEGFTVPQNFPYSAGGYAIFTDSDIGRIRGSGDQVRVTGKGNGRSFSTTFTFGVPDGCHVSKLAGPDTVVAQ